MKIFCETNCASSPNSLVLWATLKAYLRGQIIFYTKGLKKKCTAEIVGLERDILEWETEFEQFRDKKIYHLLVNKNT